MACDLPAVQVTPEKIEHCLDLLAGHIDRDPAQGRKLLPIYERLEQELEALKKETDALARIRARLKRSSDQTAARSS